MICSLSSSGLGPRLLAVFGVLLDDVGVGVGRDVEGLGVPERDGYALPFCIPFDGGRCVGGVDEDRVVMVSVGIALPLPEYGFTSSRFTGMPRDMRCRLRIFDLVQFGGRSWGIVSWTSVLYRSRLVITCLASGSMRERAGEIQTFLE